MSDPIGYNGSYIVDPQDWARGTIKMIVDRGKAELEALTEAIASPEDEQAWATKAQTASIAAQLRLVAEAQARGDRRCDRVKDLKRAGEDDVRSRMRRRGWAVVFMAEGRLEWTPASKGAL